MSKAENLASLLNASGLIDSDDLAAGSISSVKLATLDSATINGSIASGSIVSSGTITDTRGSVREFGRNISGTPVISDTNYTIPSGSSGQCIRLENTVATVTVDGNNFSRGEVITLVNQTSTAVTINFQNWGNGARVGGVNANYNGVTGPTLQAYGVCSIIAIADARVHITGNLTI